MTKCKNCKKNMFEWYQMMCDYAVCQNKKCKFEGLIRIDNLDESFNKFEELTNKIKKLRSEKC